MLQKSVPAAHLAMDMRVGARRTLSLMKCLDVQHASRDSFLRVAPFTPMQFCGDAYEHTEMCSAVKAARACVSCRYAARVGCPDLSLSTSPTRTHFPQVTRWLVYVVVPGTQRPGTVAVVVAFTMTAAGDNHRQGATFARADLYNWLSETGSNSSVHVVHPDPYTIFHGHCEPPGPSLWTT